MKSTEKTACAELISKISTVAGAAPAKPPHTTHYCILTRRPSRLTPQAHQRLAGWEPGKHDYGVGTPGRQSTSARGRGRVPACRQEPYPCPRTFTSRVLGRNCGVDQSGWSRSIERKNAPVVGGLATGGCTGFSRSPLQVDRSPPTAGVRARRRQELQAPAALGQRPNRRPVALRNQDH